MTSFQKTETINAILAMWERVTLNQEELEKFKKNLEMANSNALASIFLHYKSKLKELNIPKESTYYVSAKTYQAIEEELKNHKSQKLPKSSKIYFQDLTLLRLAEMKSSDFQVVLENEKNKPYFNPQELIKLSPEQADDILAVCLYYLILKETDDYDKGLSERKSTGTIEEIKIHFPYIKDFFSTIAQHPRLYSWKEKTLPERFEDLESELAQYLAYPTQLPIQRKRKYDEE